MICPRAGTLADCLRLSGMMPGRHARAVAVQAHFSEMIAIEDDAGLACVLGFYPLGRRRGRDEFEFWMLSRPSGASASTIRRVARLARSTFAARAQSGAIRVIAHVQPGWEPGRRLVAMLGMRRVRGAANGAERYGWSHGQDRKGCDGAVCRRRR